MKAFIEHPDVVSVVRGLPAEALHRVLSRIGLEDSGEIVSLATTDQLLEILDIDIWRSLRPGEDETFDAERFLLWLEILMESGEEAVAKRLSELPEELVFMAMFQLVLVLNLEDLSRRLSRSEDSELVDKALESSLTHDFGDYCVVARRENGWDAVLSALIALDERRPELFERLLSSCCYASWEQIEENGGLYDVLTAGEMLTSDAAADRADRRAAKGHVAPSDARAFIRLAETTDMEAIVTAEESDPITKSYFRQMTATSKTDLTGACPAPAPEASGQKLDRLVPLMGETGLLGAARPAPDSTPADGLRAALVELAVSDPGRYDDRMRELAYLSNLVVSGFGSVNRKLWPADAVAAVIEICAAGLLAVEQRSGAADDVASRANRLAVFGADKLFRLGWRSMTPRRRRELVGSGD